MVSRIVVVPFSAFLFLALVIFSIPAQAQEMQCTDTNVDGNCNIVDVQGCIAAFLGLVPCTGGTGCSVPATGQTTAYQADKNDAIPGPVDVPDDGWLEAGGTLAYADNGDGTITDLSTGLMWEKKNDDDTPHDVDNYYLWSGSGSEETIWDWLDDVNAEGGTGFAGHSDWRIPNLRELQSIVNYGVVFPGPTVSPAFNAPCAPGCTVTACSCTASFSYWTSTTNSSNPDIAWIVGFDDGYVYNGYKFNEALVRAVRGGP